MMRTTTPTRTLITRGVTMSNSNRNQSSTPPPVIYRSQDFDVAVFADALHDLADALATGEVGLESIDTSTRVEAGDPTGYDLRLSYLATDVSTPLHAALTPVATTPAPGPTPGDADPGDDETDEPSVSETLAGLDRSLRREGGTEFRGR